MLANDPLGAKRERLTTPLPQSYLDAFSAIDADLNNELIVAEAEEGNIVGVLQLTFIPSMTYQGGLRAQIEGVRVAAEHRSCGVGRELLRFAIEKARHRGCHLVQLTSDNSRPDAIRFYESLGFVASHQGLKLHLDRSSDGMPPNAVH